MKKSILTKTYERKLFGGEQKVPEEKSSPVNFLKFLQAPFIKNHLRKCISTELLQFVAASQSLTQFKKSGYPEKVMRVMGEQENKSEKGETGESDSDEDGTERDSESGESEEEETSTSAGSEEKTVDEDDDDDEEDDDDEDEAVQYEKKKNKEREKVIKMVLKGEKTGNYPGSLDFSSRLYRVPSELMEETLYEKPMSKDSPKRVTIETPQASKTTSASSCSTTEVSSKDSLAENTLKAKLSPLPTYFPTSCSSMPSLEMPSLSETRMRDVQSSRAITLGSSVNYASNRKQALSAFDNSLLQASKLDLKYKDIHLLRESMSDVVNHELNKEFLLQSVSSSRLSSIYSATSPESFIKTEGYEISGEDDENGGNDVYEEDEEDEEYDEEYLMTVESHSRPIESDSDMKLWLDTEKEMFEEDQSFMSALSPFGPNRHVQKYDQNVHSMLLKSDYLKGLAKKPHESRAGSVYMFGNKKPSLYRSQSNKEKRAVSQNEKRLRTADHNRRHTFASEAPLYPSKSTSKGGGMNKRGILIDSLKEQQLKAENRRAYKSREGEVMVDPSTSSMGDQPPYAENISLSRAKKRKLSGDSRVDTPKTSKRKFDFYSHRDAYVNGPPYHDVLPVVNTTPAHQKMPKFKLTDGFFTENGYCTSDSTTLEQFLVKTPKLGNASKHTSKSDSSDIDLIKDEIKKKLIIYNKEIFKKGRRPDNGEYERILHTILEGGNDNSANNDMSSEDRISTKIHKYKMEKAKKELAKESSSNESIESNIDEIEDCMDQIERSTSKNKNIKKGPLWDGKGDKKPTKLSASPLKYDGKIWSESEDSKIVHNYNRGSGLSVTSSAASIDFQSNAEEIKEVIDLKNYITPAQLERVKLREQLELRKLSNNMSTTPSLSVKEPSQTINSKCNSSSKSDYYNSRFSLGRNNAQMTSSCENAILNYCCKKPSTYQNSSLINNPSSDAMSNNNTPQLKNDTNSVSTVPNSAITFSNDAGNNQLDNRPNQARSQVSFEKTRKKSQLKVTETKKQETKDLEESKKNKQNKWKRRVKLEDMETSETNPDTESDGDSLNGSTKSDIKKAVKNAYLITKLTENGKFNGRNSLKRLLSGKEINKRTRSSSMHGQKSKNTLTDNELSTSVSEDESTMLDINEINKINSLGKFLKMKSKRTQSGSPTRDANSCMDVSKKQKRDASRNSVRLCLRESREGMLRGKDQVTMTEPVKTILKMHTGKKDVGTCVVDDRGQCMGETTSKGTTEDRSYSRASTLKNWAVNDENKSVSGYNSNILPSTLVIEGLQISNMKISGEKEEKAFPDTVKNILNKTFENISRELEESIVKRIDRGKTSYIDIDKIVTDSQLSSKENEHRIGIRRDHENFSRAKNYEPETNSSKETPNTGFNSSTIHSTSSYPPDFGRNFVPMDFSNKPYTTSTDGRMKSKDQISFNERAMQNMRYCSNNESQPLDFSAARCSIRAQFNNSCDEYSRGSCPDSDGSNEPLNLSTDADFSYNGIYRQDYYSDFEPINFSKKCTKAVSSKVKLIRRVFSPKCLLPASVKPIDYCNSESTEDNIKFKIDIIVNPTSSTDSTISHVGKLSPGNASTYNQSISEETIQLTNEADENVGIYSANASFTEAKTPSALKVAEDNENNLTFNRENSLMSLKLPDDNINPRQPVLAKQGEKKKLMKVVDCSNYVREACSTTYAELASSTLNFPTPSEMDRILERPYANKPHENMSETLSGSDFKSVCYGYDYELESSRQDSLASDQCHKKFMRKLLESPTPKQKKIDHDSPHFKPKEVYHNFRDTIGSIFKKKSKSPKNLEELEQKVDEVRLKQIPKSNFNQVYQNTLNEPTQEKLFDYNRHKFHERRMYDGEFFNKTSCEANSSPIFQSPQTGKDPYAQTSDFDIEKYMMKLKAEFKEAERQKSPIEKALKSPDWLADLKRNDSVLAEISLEKGRIHRETSPDYDRLMRVANRKGLSYGYENREILPNRFKEPTFEIYPSAENSKFPYEFLSAFMTQKGVEIAQKIAAEKLKQDHDDANFNADECFGDFLKSLSSSKQHGSNNIKKSEVEQIPKREGNEDLKKMEEVTKTDLETQTSHKLIQAYLEEMSNKMTKLSEVKKTKKAVKTDKKDKRVEVKDENKELSCSSCSERQTDTILSERGMRDESMNTRMVRSASISKKNTIYETEVSSKSSSLFKSAPTLKIKKNSTELVIEPLANDHKIPVTKIEIEKIKEVPQEDITLFKDESVRDFLNHCSQKKWLRETTENEKMKNNELLLVAKWDSLPITPMFASCKSSKVDCISRSSNKKTPIKATHLCPKYPAKYCRTMNSNTSNNCDVLLQNIPEFSLLDVDQNQKFTLEKKSILEYLKKTLPIKYYNYIESNSDSLGDQLYTYMNLEDPWSGERILSKAVREKDHRVVEQLLEMGAVVDAEDSKGRSAFTIATSLNDQKSIEILLNHGVPLDNLRFLKVAMLYIKKYQEFLAFLSLLFKHGWKVPGRYRSEVLKILKDLESRLGGSEEVPQLISNLTTPHSLQSVCRWQIREHLLKVSKQTSTIYLIKALPLPTPLKHFLITNQFCFQL